MASFTLFAGSTVAQTLASGEFGIITQLGALATSGTAIAAAGSSEVSVYGTLHSANGQAIDFDGTAFEAFIGAGAAVGSNGSDTINANASSRASVLNDGSIQSTSDALDLRGAADGASIEIVNTGNIMARSDGIVASAAGGSVLIENSGNILGGTGGIDHFSGDLTLLNHGRVAGDDYGVRFEGDFLLARNYGTINGGLRVVDGEAEVFNRGIIDVLDFGDGDDSYFGARGFVEDEIRGDSGNDTLRGGDDVDVIFGGADDDNLRGRGGDDRINGGSGKDAIFGNHGNDLLTGGSHGDTFHFAANGGTDTVTDFIGKDRLDVSRLGLKGFNADIRDHIAASRDGSVIDLHGEYDVVIILEGVDVSELGGNDFIF